jgi:sugar transferase (PEP-CTERM/EpsH1 system associated)
MPRSIKILHVLHTFAPGGLENGVVNIINKSPSHLVHELCLLSRAGDFVNRLTKPVVYHEMNKRAGNDFRMMFRLRDLFMRRGVDVVHTRNWGGFDGVMAACLTKRPALIHGEHGRDFDDPGGLKQRRNVARRLLAFRAKKFVTVSKDMYTWLQSTVSIPQEKLTLIPNGVDTARFRPGRDLELRRELGIAEDEFVVGTIGRLDPIKNHVGLIESVGLLRNDGKVRLVIVGDGPERGRVEDALRKFGGDLRPLLLGYRADVERLYRTFDAFALNSFAEGMSNTLLEAMSSGLPIICTGVGGNVELVAHRRTGMIVQSGDNQGLADAIREYAADEDLRSLHGDNARRFIVQNFSLEKMVQRYVALYESVG